MEKLSGRVVVVTGAASGIGRATAILAAKEGAKIAICDIDVDGGEKTRSRIVGSGGVAKNYHCDVTVEENVKRVFEGISGDLGQVYGLVNDAGIGGVMKPIHEIEEREWDEVLAVNLKGVFLCTKYAIPQMIKLHRGSIVNVSSTVGILGGASTPYSASKGAVRLMTKTDALYYAKYKIRINSIHPGSTNTPMAKRAADASGDPASYFRREGGAIPLGRLAKPTEIASVIVFLLSDDSSYMTGSEVIVDGGATIAIPLEFSGSSDSAK